ncbi:hypothetical protein BJY01DRAFT_63428 [Aspergillus pseudoustus]|uniref:Secreted protein n=1 Tax=Aspergillus pseudoustus TaxID=1810923 RepID=A0ABR4J7C2_9EURO
MSAQLLVHWVLQVLFHPSIHPSSMLLPRRLQFILFQTQAAANAVEYQSSLTESSSRPQISLILTRYLRKTDAAGRVLKGTHRPAAGILPPSYLRCMIDDAHPLEATWHCHYRHHSQHASTAHKQPPRAQLHIISEHLQQFHLQMRILKLKTDASLPGAWTPLSPVGFRGVSLVRGLSRILNTTEFALTRV